MVKLYDSVSGLNFLGLEEYMNGFTYKTTKHREINDERPYQTVISFELSTT